MLLPSRHRAEIFINNAWVDITQYVRGEDRVKIKRGAQNESIGATTVEFTLNNHDGIFSNANPNSEYFGLLDLNTQFRWSIPGLSYLATRSGTGSRLDTINKPSLNITADLDSRVELRPGEWANTALMGKYNPVGDQRSWVFYINSDRCPVFRWYPAGTALSEKIITSTVAVPFEDNERGALRVTIDVNNGAGNAVVTFYYADDLDSAWTTLNSQNVGTTTSLGSSTANLELGGFELFLVSSIVGPDTWTYRAELRNGIDGTIVASPDLRSLLNKTSFTDAQGNIWTPFDDGYIIPDSVRVAAALSTFPEEWEVGDYYVPMVGGDIFQRYLKGSRQRLDYDVATRETIKNLPIHLWPLDEAEGSTEAAPTSDGPVMKLGKSTGSTWRGKFGAHELAPWLATGLSVSTTTNDFYISSQVEMPVITTEYTYDYAFVLSVNGEITATINGDGPAETGNPRISFVLEVRGANAGTAGYTLSIIYEEEVSSSTTVLSSQAAGEVDDGLPHHIRLHVATSGATSSWAVYLDGFPMDSGTAVDAPFQPPVFHKLLGTVLSSDEDGALLRNVSIWNSLPDDTIYQAVTTGWAGETAGGRIKRLCGEENIPLFFVGSADDTPAMGPQLHEPFMALLKAAVEVDQGLLYATRWELGATYRTHLSLYNGYTRPISYTDGLFSGKLKPLRDEAILLNNIVSKRYEESFYLNPQGISHYAASEPDGPRGETRVGTYDEELTYQVESGDTLRQITHHRLQRGTTNYPRFTDIQFELHRPQFETHSNERELIQLLDIGIPFAITNASRLSSFDIELLARGFQEIHQNFETTIYVNALPYDPYRVAEAGEVSRVAADDDITLSSDVTSSATSFVITSVSGKSRWVTPASDPYAAEDFPMYATIGGELVQITNVTPLDGQVMNLNPYFETNIDDWVGLSGGTITHSTARGYESNASLLLTPDGVSGAPEARTVAKTAVASRRYLAEAWVFCNVARTARIGIVWRDAANVLISSVLAANVNLSANTWTYLSHLLTAPANTAFAQLTVVMGGTPPASHLLNIDNGTIREFDAASGDTQTLTVVRSINGIIKAHSAGTPINPVIQGKVAW